MIACAWKNSKQKVCLCHQSDPAKNSFAIEIHTQRFATATWAEKTYTLAQMAHIPVCVLNPPQSCAQTKPFALHFRKLFWWPDLLLLLINHGIRLKIDLSLEELIISHLLWYHKNYYAVINSLQLQFSDLIFTSQEENLKILQKRRGAEREEFLKNKTKRPTKYVVPNFDWNPDRFSFKKATWFAIQWEKCFLFAQ